jgi:isovaleryl-CoA dehydrogenase
MAYLKLNLDNELIYKNALAYSRKYLASFVDVMEKEDIFPEEIWELLAKQGYLGVGVPEKYGGSGGSILEAALVCQAISRVSPAIALSYGAHLNLCAHNIVRNGTNEQKEQYLPKLCSGEMIGGLALTEPNYGSDAMNIQLTAKKEQTGWLLNGSKMFITNGNIANLLVTYARTTKEAGAKGLTAFLVETKGSGFSVTKKLDKLGMMGSPTCEILFENVFVPNTNRIGEVDKGYLVAMGGLDLERAFLVTVPIGIMEECLELSLTYSQQRAQFGKTISNHQLIKAKLADMYVHLQLSRSFVYELLKSAEKGNRISKDAAAVILFAGEKAMEVAHQAVQIHGGYGYVKEFAVERFFRDAKLLEIGAGTSEIRRLLIADELLGNR